ncbi:CLUMA_CG011150, isoform A [Clunio marinus]|uniref:CLUMA_CG011150, isoform A n=1 Tax=Clunio marinus TaxID=568069 RepID=A0A1J1IC45_9DIPT|nr:CLUMA_CG011150, isoform A [Clunio marinus]
MSSTVPFLVRIVCYWQGIIPASEITPEICTHIIFSFIGVNDSGNLIYLYSDEAEIKRKLNEFQKLKSKNPKLTLMAAVGGANDELLNAFDNLSKTESGRENFINEIIKFMNENSLTGIDIDWEYPRNDEEKENFILLLRDLHSRFSLSNFTLSIAVAPEKWRSEKSYDIPRLVEYVDFINLMTYDFHGSWDETVGHHTQMFPHHGDSSYIKELNCAASISYWKSNKVPAEKLNLGIATYGKTFVLSDISKHRIGSIVDVEATKNTSGIIGYNEFCTSLGWKQHFDTNYRAYYAVKDDSWFGFDTKQQVKTKARYAKEHNLGGVMFWSLDTDSNENCKHGKFALISEAFKELNS